MNDTEIHVAPSGSAVSDGTSDVPCTIDRALDILSDLRKSGNDRPATVILQDCQYRLEKTVFVTLDLVGKELRFVAAVGARPVLSGAVMPSDWRRIDTPIPGASNQPSSDMWVASLPRIENDRPINPKTLYRGNERLPRAKSSLFSIQSESLNTFTLTDQKTVLDADSRSLELFIRPSQKWCFNILPIAEANSRTGVYSTTVPATYPLTGEGFFENVPSRLLNPGECATDPAAGVLYYRSMPGESPEDSLRIPFLEELVCVAGDVGKEESIRNVSFDGITFIHGDRYTIEENDIGLQHDWDFFDKPNALLRFRYAENCVVRNCRFMHSGGDGVRLDLRARSILIDGNEFCDLGATAVLAAGFGPGLKNENGNHVITGNHIHGCGEIYRHSTAVFIWQSGDNLIARNHIHDLPYTAIVVSSVRSAFFEKKEPLPRECAPSIRLHEVGVFEKIDRCTLAPFRHSQGNIIEYNYVHNVVRGQGYPIAMGDGNGIYLSGTDGYNEVRRNLVAGVHEGHGGIRTDDECWGTTIHHNVLTDCWFVAYVHKNTNDFTNNFILIPPYSSGIAFRARDEHEGTRICENIFVVKSWGCSSFLEVIRTKGVYCDRNQYWSLINRKDAEKILSRHREAGLDVESTIALPAQYEAVARIEPSKLTVAEANALTDML